MNSNPTTVVVIGGPTAAGKTQVALQLAQHVPVEVVCADSRQVYAMLDIGTAKPTLQEMQTCPHHLFSVVDPANTVTAGEYAAWVRTIIATHADPATVLLLVGGTGLYIQAALDGLSSHGRNTSQATRGFVNSELERLGATGLYQWLQKVDPAAAAHYPDKNPRRVQRALEFILENDRPFSEILETPADSVQANIHFFSIYLDTSELNKRIEDRCNAMWNDGIVEETQNLLSHGIQPQQQSLRTIGYEQVLQYLGYGEQLSRTDAIERHIVATRQYAKRQRTWFRRDTRYQWLHATTAVSQILHNIAVTVCVLALLAIGHVTAAPAATDSTRLPPLPAIPTQFDSAQAIALFKKYADSVLNSDAFKGADVSCQIWNLRTNKLLFERNPTQNLTPASTTKLFTTAAAYHALGSGGALVTELRMNGRLNSDGVLDGDLYLVGCGDAMLSVNDMEYLADQAYRMGLRKVRGKLYADDSFFDHVGNRAVYSGDFEDVQHTAPVYPLSVNEGSVSVVVSASRKGTVSVQVLPNTTAVVVQVAPAVRQKRRRKKRSSLSVSQTVLKDGRIQITVTGAPRPNRTQTFHITVQKPALVAVGVLESRLQAGGIQVNAGIGVKAAPQSSRILSQVQRPLSEYCSVVNKRSHNFYAEQLFKFVGGRYGGRTNTAAVARKAVLATLDSLRVPHRGMILNDGSGLSRRNRVCAATEVDLLKAVWKQPYGTEFYHTLSVAGVDGTIRRRLAGTIAAEYVFAKTGTLRNTSSLAGYAVTLDGEDWCFSIISNGPNPSAYKKAENLLAIRMAGFSYNPLVTERTPVSGSKLRYERGSGTGSSEDEFIDDGSEE